MCSGTFYWGKPTVRNFRGDDGNVGIIRSPLRAIVLPDHRFVIATPTSLAWRKAASGQPITRGCFGVAGVPSPGHAFKGTPCEPRRARAATLAVDPVGESPTGGNYPVATVVIPGGGEGDQTVESPEVKVSCKGGEQLSRL